MKKLKKYEIITICLTIFVIVTNLIQNKKIRDLSYKDRALEHKPIYTIRTFPSSKRFKNLILLFNEDGLSIQSIFPEHIDKVNKLIK